MRMRREVKERRISRGHLPGELLVQDGRRVAKHGGNQSGEGLHDMRLLVGDDAGEQPERG